MEYQEPPDSRVEQADLSNGPHVMIPTFYPVCGADYRLLKDTEISVTLRTSERWQPSPAPQPRYYR